MDGYNSVTHIARVRSDYLPVVRKCVEAHRKEQKKQYCVGFEWHDVGVEPSILRTLYTTYDFLQVAHKTSKRTYYMVKDIEGAEKALHDIEAERVVTPSKQGRALRVWISNKTIQKLNTYLSSEFSDEPDAESIVIERALNLFLDGEDETSHKAGD